MRSLRNVTSTLNGAVDDLDSKVNAIAIARNDVDSTVQDGADPHQIIEESKPDKLKTKHAGL